MIAGLTRFAIKATSPAPCSKPPRFRRAKWSKPWQKDSAIPIDVLRTDGGMVENDLLMQFQADILNIPVVRPQ